MSKFIPINQLSKLREAAKGGDEMAKKILMAQLNDEDFSSDLEAYFKPQEEEAKTVEEAAEIPQEEAKQTVPTQQNPEAQAQVPVLTGKIEQNEISDGILALINACDKKTLELANDSEISEATKKGALSILQEIKQNSLENLEKYAKLASSFAKKYVDEEE
jgi:hypothetical protein